jgi:hypothetical protein
MALRQGRDTDSNPESRGAFPPLFRLFYPRRGKAFPSKEGFLYCGIPPFGRILIFMFPIFVEFLPLVGYSNLLFKIDFQEVLMPRLANP